MKINKVIMLMGDRIYLFFFVDDNHKINNNQLSVWFEDIYGKSINLGDNYNYLIDKSNKKVIKEDLRIHFMGENDKGIYKELMTLLNKVKEYESR